MDLDHGAARRSLAQLLAVEQIEEPRHVAGVGTDRRGQRPHAERRGAVAERPHQAARLGGVERAAVARGRPRAPLLTAGGDEHGRPVQHEAHVAGEIDVPDPLVGQPLAGAGAEKRRDHHERVGRRRLSTPVTSPTRRGSSCRRDPIASAALAPAGVLIVSRASATSFVLVATLVDQWLGGSAGSARPHAAKPRCHSAPCCPSRTTASFRTTGSSIFRRILWDSAFYLTRSDRSVRSRAAILIDVGPESLRRLGGWYFHGLGWRSTAVTRSSGASRMAGWRRSFSRPRWGETAFRSP